ncbi:MAG: hypothetical protein ABUK01_06575 [Leptospirales bacterium]
MNKRLKSFVTLSLFIFPMLVLSAQGSSDYPTLNNDDFAIESTDNENDDTKTDFSGYPADFEADDMQPDPGKKFLEIAIDSIHRNDFIAAVKFLNLAMEEGDEDIYWEATILAYYVRALQGHTDMVDEIEVLDDVTKAKAMYFTADGWHGYTDTHPEKKDIYEQSLEMREKLIAIYPDSEWSIRATMQLVSLLLNGKKYERALSYLLQYLKYAKGNPDLEYTEIDRAWFYLGFILEKSKEHRDLYKALRAYKKIPPESRYYLQARQRIEKIEKFYFITASE